MTNPNIDDTLKERGTRYGVFAEHARITQAIKRAMRDSPNWESLPDDMKEALEMDAHKTGRILNGDPNFHDSWHDKIGYVKLVADRLIPPPATGAQVIITGGGGPGDGRSGGGGGAAPAYNPNSRGTGGGVTHDLHDQTNPAAGR